MRGISLMRDVRAGMLSLGSRAGLRPPGGPGGGGRQGRQPLMHEHRVRRSQGTRGCQSTVLPSARA